MKIVVVDGAALTGPELNWRALHEQGRVEVHDRTPPDQVVHRCQAADVIVTNKVPMDRRTLEQLPDLKMIGVTATGYNIIDLTAAREHGVVVCNVPAYSTPAVAQHVFAMLLAFIHRPEEHHAAVQQGAWVRSPDFCFALNSTFELSGKTMGIVGLGQIGTRVAELAAAFGMRVVVYSRSQKDPEAFRFKFQQVDQAELFRTADVVSLHCPQTKENHGFVNADLFGLMKANAVLVNTARGTLVDEADLARALRQNQIGGACLDVVAVEPMEADNPLLGCPRCLITPHNAWATLESRQRCLDVTIENVKGFLLGTPQNVVS